VSEASTPNTPEEQPASDAVKPTPAAAPASKPRSAGGSSLAAFALLIGLVGAGAGGWSLWQLQQMHSQDQQRAEDLQRTRDDSARKVEELAQRLDSRLSALPSAAELDERRRLLANLQNDQQRLSQRLESVLDGSRQDWRLDEAEHLLRLATLRLSALQDVASAEALVTAADDVLREQDDPAAFAAREQLSRSLEALRTTARPDRVGLFLQLGACVSRLLRSIPWRRLSKGRATYSRIWPPKAMAVPGGANGRKSFPTTSVSSSTLIATYVRCCPGRACRRCA